VILDEIKMDFGLNLIQKFINENSWTSSINLKKKCKV
jgi:hypothetical protein